MNGRHRTLALAALVACVRSASPAPIEAPSRPRFTQQTHAPVVATLQRMALVRELAIMHDVEQIALSREALLAKVESHVARTVPRAEIANEELFLKTIGVIPSDADYERSVYAAIRDTNAGMYEPFDKKMYVPDDLAPPVLEMSVAHESVHALQDQHFDLGAFERFTAGASDTMLAHSCLVEGDATSATDERDDSDAVDANATSYVEREIVAPYIVGTAFVRALRRRGGWSLVDQAWTRSGLTTEQVLHPEKWLASERALDVPVPTFTTLGPTAVRVATDVRGELGLRLVLESAVPHAAAVAGANGWGGDSLALVRTGGSGALAWRIRFDDETSAQTAFAAISQAFAARACAVTKDDRDVLVLVGPPTETCTRWSKEIFAVR